MRQALIILGGAVAGCVLLFIAGAIAGGGHGTYGAASLLFPYSMLATGLTGNLNPALVILALVQYPIYSVFLAFAENTRKTAGVLAGVHAVLAFLAWFGRAGTFVP